MGVVVTGRRSGVVIADDDAGARRLFTAMLEERDGQLEVLASVGDARAAVAAAERHRPALALVDVRMPGGGVAATRGILERSPGTRVVAISAHTEVAPVREMLAAGAHAYVVKGTPLDEVLQTLSAVLDMPLGRRAADPRGGSFDVVLAEPDPRTLEAVAAVIDGVEGLRLVGLAQTLHHAVSLAARHAPQVIIVGGTLPTGGAAAIGSLRAAAPKARFVGLVRRGHPDMTLSLVRGGVDALVIDDVTGPTVLSAITRVLRDQEGRFHTGEAATAAIADQQRVERVADVIAGGQLAVAMQPILDLGSERPRGFEALARFPSDPSRGPDVWFAEARRVGLGEELELLAVRRALDVLDQVADDAFLAINVSPATAELDALCEQLEGIGSGRVVLELTEHAPVDDYRALRRALARLRELGVRVAVDDCGAGFSSLSHVAQLAPEFLKLDGVLCRDMRSPVQSALARALVSFAADIGSTVVAEGIEHGDDLAVLRDLGVQLGQGYLLAPPASVGHVLG
jgi:EAL domain-containing protein (putative c-di-GMP-specific phosphodiesterase class I)/DNA-binding NarL/FixJ family response regulator